MNSGGDIKKYFANSKFLYVIVDGSTDSSITDNQMVYLQSCQNGFGQNYFHLMLPGAKRNSIWYCKGY